LTQGDSSRGGAAAFAFAALNFAPWRRVSLMDPTFLAAIWLRLFS
jgi:hypothetical protein